MKLFFRYLYFRRRIIIASAVFIAVFAVSFWLFRLPVKAVAYPALLCAIIAAGLIAADFRKAAKNHRIYELAAQNSDDPGLDIPEPRSLEAEDMGELVTALRSDMKELRDLSEAKHRDTVDYYTVWVHQIKTPIASMRLSLQNEDTPLSHKLYAELMRIESYVEMVLAYLRLDSVSSDYVFKEYPLDGIIKQAVKRFASEFILKKISLEYGGTDISAVTDEKWLRFVIEQLLSNSLKYTREGSVKIYFKEPRTLCIEDTGIGIAPEDLPRVFEKGYTGCNGRLDSRSSGLGLYLCKRICRNLGADISIASEIGKGTAVSLKLEQYELDAE